MPELPESTEPNGVFDDPLIEDEDDFDPIFDDYYEEDDSDGEGKAGDSENG